MFSLSSRLDRNHANLLVGRASAENATEMSNFVYKTLAYENDTSSYKKSVLTVGEQLGFGGVSEYAKDLMEEIRLGVSKHGYTTSGFAKDPSFSAATLYDKDAVWNKSALIGKINSNAYSIINHLGHANYNYVMKFSNPDADVIDSSKFLFAYSQGCIPGNFEEDCIAEHLTTSTRYGMFAVVFNARYGWGAQNSTDGSSQRYNREFWDAYFAENMTQVGRMNADSHEDNAWRISEPCMRWCYYESNLLGDPATSLAVVTGGSTTTTTISTTTTSTTSTTVSPTTTTTTTTLRPSTTTTVKPTTTTTTTIRVTTTSAPPTTTTTTTVPNGDYSNSLGMTFKLIPAGTFMMGSPEDEPGRWDDETRHQVTLTKSFYMQTTEVTQGQWKAVMGSNPSYFPNCGDNCPVETVSWDDVQGFITALNGRGEGTYRLPTEAEWEYAARAGTSTPFYFGQCLSTNQGNYDGNYPLSGCSEGEYRAKTIPAASLQANGWGLYDMYGNVWEWVQDWYGAYPTGSVTDPAGPNIGSDRVHRGGSWYSFARFCRSAYRYRYSPDNRFSYLGLRLLLPPGQQR